MPSRDDAPPYTAPVSVDPESGSASGGTRSGGAGPSPGCAGGEEALLVAFLRDRDAPCPGCGYNLRGLGAARCPECGHRLRLAVERPERGHGAWAAVVAATWAGAGAGLVFLAIALGRGNVPGRFPMREAVFWFFACMPLAAHAVSHRGAFLRLNPAARRRWAAAAVGATALAFALLFLGVLF